MNQESTGFLWEAYSMRLVPCTSAPVLCTAFHQERFASTSIENAKKFKNLACEYVGNTINRTKCFGSQNTTSHGDGFLYAASFHAYASAEPLPSKDRL
jgi:hypothetical protein